MLNRRDLKEIDIKQFRKLCKMNGIKGYSGKKKEWMLDILNCHRASRKIQHHWRKKFYAEAVDSIDFDDVSHPCFIYKPVDGKRYFYRFETIISYIIKTGDVRDPCTRITYTDEELTRLDELAKCYGYKYRSTLKIKKNRNYIRRIQERQNIVSTLECRLSEITQNIEYILENNIFDWEDSGYFTIHNTTYTNFRMYIAENLTEYRIRIRSLQRYDNDSAIRIHRSIQEKINQSTL